MNMRGNLELNFYMEDTNPAEMDAIFDEISDEIDRILLEYEIMDIFDWQVTQECHEVKNRYSDLIEYEKQGGSIKETAKKAAGLAKQFILNKLPKKIES